VINPPQISLILQTLGYPLTGYLADSFEDYTDKRLQYKYHEEQDFLEIRYSDSHQRAVGHHNGTERHLAHSVTRLAICHAQ